MAEKRMSPKRRFLAGIFGGRTDRLPVGSPTSVATVELMEMAQAFFPQVHNDPQGMARLAQATHEVLGYDCVLPYFGVDQEAAALGCAMNWGSLDEMPIATTHPYANPEDIHIPDNLLELPPLKAVLEALEILRHSLGEHVAIIGKVMGPWTLAYHLNGVQPFLMDTLLAPDRVRRFLDILKMVSIRFGKAQVQAGADVLCIGDHATGDLVSPQCYRDFLLPLHQEMLAELGCPAILHICGDTASRLEYIVQAGFDAFHFDSKVDACKATSIVKKRISLIGNVNNPDTLFFGQPEDAYREALYAAQAGVEILAPECAIPLRVPIANLKAIVTAAEDYAKGVRIEL